MVKINLDILKIQSIIMNGIIKLCVFIILISFIYRIFKYKYDSKYVDISTDEMFINLLKFTGYFLLAGYIYIIMRKNEFPEIDVLTFFTFMLACFEATHNFIYVMVDGISYILGSHFSKRL